MSQHSMTENHDIIIIIIVIAITTATTTTTTTTGTAWARHAMCELTHCMAG